MRLDITGRNVDITPAIREFAEEKLRKLRKVTDGPLEAHVVLRVEDRHRHSAEIQVKSGSVSAAGAEETHDLYQAIGDVVDKVERQLRRQKERRHNHKHLKTPKN